MRLFIKSKLLDSLWGDFIENFFDHKRIVCYFLLTGDEHKVKRRISFFYFLWVDVLTVGTLFFLII
jgi:hypothetical protein